PRAKDHMQTSTKTQSCTTVGAVYDRAVTDRAYSCQDRAYSCQDRAYSCTALCLCGSLRIIVPHAENTSRAHEDIKDTAREDATRRREGDREAACGGQAHGTRAYRETSR